MKFNMDIKVGDIVKGNVKSLGYPVTSAKFDFIGEVTNVWGSFVWVEVIDHKFKEVIGKEYQMHKEAVRLCTDGPVIFSNKISVKKIFDSLMFAEKSLIKSYENRDETLKKNILYEFRDKFLRMLEYYVDTNSSTELKEEFLEYKRNKEGRN